MNIFWKRNQQTIRIQDIRERNSREITDMEFTWNSYEARSSSEISLARGEAPEDSYLNIGQALMGAQIGLML